MPLSVQEAKAIGKTQGYESGWLWGSLLGAGGAIAGAVSTVTLVVVGPPVIIAGAAVAGVGYLAGGIVGGEVGAWRGEIAAEHKVVLEPLATEEAVRNCAASASSITGGTAGGITGMAVGATVGSIASASAAQRIPQVLDRKFAECLDFVEETNAVALLGLVAGSGMTIHGQSDKEIE